MWLVEKLQGFIVSIRQRHDDFQVVDPTSIVKALVRREYSE